METEPDYEIKAEDKAGIGRAGKVGLGLILAAVIGFIWLSDHCTSAVVGTGDF